MGAGSVAIGIAVFRGNPIQFVTKSGATLIAWYNPRNPGLPLGIIERGGTVSLRSRTCVKRSAAFGGRFKGLSLHFLYQNGNLIRIKTGLDTCLIRIQTRTPL